MVILIILTGILISMLTGQNGIKTIYFRDKEGILYEIINFITIFQSFIKILVVFIRK